MPKRWQRRARQSINTEMDAILKNFPKEKALIESIPDKDKREMVKLRLLVELRKSVQAQELKN